METKQKHLAYLSFLGPFEIGSSVLPSSPHVTIWSRHSTTAYKHNTLGFGRMCHSRVSSNMYKVLKHFILFEIIWENLQKALLNLTD